MMHTGEEWFQLNWQQYVGLLILLASYMLLSFRGKLPRIAAFKDFLDAVNSAGGHIFLLFLLTVWSIKIAMQFFYHVISLPVESFDKSQALITAGVAFVQGTLAGTFIGALLKTMSGGKANGQPPSPDTLTATVTPEK